MTQARTLEPKVAAWLRAALGGRVEARFDFAFPVVAGGYLWATDGRAARRAPAPWLEDGRYELDDDGRVARCSNQNQLPPVGKLVDLLNTNDCEPFDLVWPPRRAVAKEAWEDGNLEIDVVTLSGHWFKAAYIDGLAPDERPTDCRMVPTSKVQNAVRKDHALVGRLSGDRSFVVMEYNPVELVVDTDP